jgi:membrane protein YdbS with pleckstrin-like domain
MMVSGIFIDQILVSIIGQVYSYVIWRYEVQEHEVILHAILRRVVS